MAPAPTGAQVLVKPPLRDSLLVPRGQGSRAAGAESPSGTRLEEEHRGPTQARFHRGSAGTGGRRRPRLRGDLDLGSESESHRRPHRRREPEWPCRGARRQRSQRPAHPVRLSRGDPARVRGLRRVRPSAHRRRRRGPDRDRRPALVAAALHRLPAGARELRPGPGAGGARARAPRRGLAGDVPVQRQRHPDAARARQPGRRRRGDVPVGVAPAGADRPGHRGRHHRHRRQRPGLGCLSGARLAARQVRGRGRLLEPRRDAQHAARVEHEPAELGRSTRRLSRHPRGRHRDRHRRARGHPRRGQRARALRGHGARRAARGLQGAERRGRRRRGVGSARVVHRAPLHRLGHRRDRRRLSRRPGGQHEPGRHVGLGWHRRRRGRGQRGHARRHRGVRGLGQRQQDGVHAEPGRGRPGHHGRVAAGRQLAAARRRHRGQLLQRGAADVGRRHRPLRRDEARGPGLGLRHRLGARGSHHRRDPLPQHQRHQHGDADHRRAVRADPTSQPAAHADRAARRPGEHRRASDRPRQAAALGGRSVPPRSQLPSIVGLGRARRVRGGQGGARSGHHAGDRRGRHRLRGGRAARGCGALDHAA